MDSRRYRKICAALAAARWRLRFVVGVCRVAPVQPFQTAKRSGLIGQSPLPERDIAATGKISTELAAARWRLRFVVGVCQLLRAAFPDC
jgi:hypothetical protein